MSAFDRLATETASTKRLPAISNGKRGTATVNVGTISCTPLDPVDADLQQRLELDTPHELLQTFVRGDPDIIEGDIFTYDELDYPIRSCEEWKWSDDIYLRLVLEDLKDS